LDVKLYVDQNVEHFKNLLKILNISNDGFIRTTDDHHIKAAQEM
jgi:methionyl-tRNA synthetase